MKKVVIIQRLIAPYRVPFYDRLRSLLISQGIDLEVVYGQPRAGESEAFTDLPWGTGAHATYWQLRNRFLVWLPCLESARQADLIIVEQANKNLHMHVLMALRHFIKSRLALWGHGRNFQVSTSLRWSEKIKHRISRHVDFWFAYTELSRRIVTASGFPEDRVVAVNNAIDTEQERRNLAQVTAGDLAALRTQFGVSETAQSVIFCSRLYAGKRIEFLLDCAREVRRDCPDFHLFIIGSGPEAERIQAMSRDNCQWLHYVGPQYGVEKAKFFKLAKAQLMPGLVGLHVLDSFALACPLITTQGPHGPEICYLKSGCNGIMTEDDPTAYIAAIRHLLQHPEEQQKLRDGCLEGQKQYSVDNMAERFTAGILQALSK